MLQDGKAFAKAVIKSLDELGVSEDKKERSQALAKMTNITRQQAWALLEGHLTDLDTAREVARELEIDIHQFIKL